MIKNNKSNKKLNIKSIFIFLLLSICVIFITNPAKYATSCLNALSVWTLNVLPVMFPFFVFTRLIVNLVSLKPNFMDKFFSKLYHTPAPSFLIYFLSILSGYPMGAKLICVMYDSNYIDNVSAKKMLSFCSVSGPMFIVGTVGVAFFKNYIVGIIILIANIIASLLNGLIYRGKNTITSNNSPNYQSKKNDNVLTDSVYDSLISILMVGAYIVLSFLLIDILKNLSIFDFISNSICRVFKINNSQDIVNSVLIGIIEITRGTLDLSNTQSTIQLSTIIASTIIAFGGFSVMMQSISFLNKLHIPLKTILLQKTTQVLISLVVSIILTFIFL